MKAKIKKTEKKQTQYEVGILYIQKTSGTVVLCDRNDDEKLRGIVIVPGNMRNYYSGETHFIGEYRADWSNTFTKFDGEITLIQ
jgi:hypothetical protein